MNYAASLIVVALLFATPGFAQTTPGAEANRVLNHISDALLSGRAKKPITRAVITPAWQSRDLTFAKQSDLTSDLVDRYLSRAISHFLPWNSPLRSREFLRNTGTKYIHWSHLLWGPPPPDWKTLSAEIDAVHSSDWGADVVYEAGVMEAIYKSTIDSVPIPDWLYQCMEELGINSVRKPGPNGPKFFSYENMFDRNAENWPKENIGRWSKDDKGRDLASVPDITMVETQLWFAYLITEYIDAGFEGIFFGQYGLVGSRDAGSECVYELAQFAKRLAAARAYRNAVFLSTHHYCVPYKGQLAPDSPTIFTHMTWPSRLFYSSKFGHGMECGLYAAQDGQHRTAGEFNMLVKKPPFDLPILIEIDNYGQVSPGSPIACNAEGDDEITAYMKKPHSARAAFLRHYYHEFQTYRNKVGKRRVHLAPSGERMGYMPYKEAGGEEEVIKELFNEAVSGKKAAGVWIPAASEPTGTARPEIAWKTYRDKKRNFSLLCPANAQPADKSARIKPRTPGSFWTALTLKKPSCVINVRHVNLAAEATADDYAESNQYLLEWERLTANGITGFWTTTLDPASGKATHRALLVDGKSVWMVNLADLTGGDPGATKQIFERVVRSLNVKGLEPVSAEAVQP